MLYALLYATAPLRSAYRIVSRTQVRSRTVAQDQGRVQVTHTTRTRTYGTRIVSYHVSYTFISIIYYRTTHETHDTHTVRRTYTYTAQQLR